MNALDLIWLVPLLPFLGATANGLLVGRLPRTGVDLIALGTPLASLALGLTAIVQYIGSLSPEPFSRTLYVWAASDITLDVGFQLDPLSCVMLFVVTFVGFLIHVYSVGYMAHEEGYQRYFAYLNLFMGAMLLLVLGNNFLVLFVGWEGVGLCSYLLIGFYFDQTFPPYAGRKAFIVNRIGDFAFLVGLFALAERFGSLGFTEIFGAIEADPSLVTGEYVLGMSFATFVGLCLF
ncbi:MAG: proton-conducting transporter membrane subunit, partial [Thermoanaerobaculia bacterium]|nr:proton-conducting transporter membrane subunit [Thermoanaerobaculia bacterium]